MNGAYVFLGVLLIGFLLALILAITAIKYESHRIKQLAEAEGLEQSEAREQAAAEVNTKARGGIPVVVAFVGVVLLVLILWGIGDGLSSIDQVDFDVDFEITTTTS